jgi:putative photosynthetic complex assembly protein
VPYKLEAWPNGQLSLTDTGTGRSIELSAFGPTNREAFAGLLK